MRRLLALAALVALPYWPGEPFIRTDAAPEYPRRIKVIDTLGVRDRHAFPEWNRCDARVRLVKGRQRLAETPGTITILKGKEGDWPRGGWVGDHGVLLLPPGRWERSIPVMRHEFGHALGFGHTRRRSIMGPSNHVQPVDCRGLRRYYRNR